MTPDIQAELIADATARFEGTRIEAVEVVVLTDDESLARALAPQIAAELWPDRVYGTVIDAARSADGWAVIVIDRGPRRFTPTAGAVHPPIGSRS